MYSMNDNFLQNWDLNSFCNELNDHITCTYVMKPCICLKFSCGLVCNVSLQVVVFQRFTLLMHSNEKYQLFAVKDEITLQKKYIYFISNWECLVINIVLCLLFSCYCLWYFHLKSQCYASGQCG